MMAAENVLLCDACTFMPAVRECARCGRELCFDCLKSHLCRRPQ